MSNDRALRARGIRQLVTRQMFEEGSDEVREVLCILRHLEPEMVTVARRCHRVLIREARRDLRETGIACFAYFALITPLYNFLDVSRLNWEHGSWMPTHVAATA